FEVGVAERARQHVAQSRRLRVLELDHEVSDAHPSEVSAQQADEERKRQQEEGGDLPPEEVVVGEGASDVEGVEALEDRTQPEGHRSQKKGRENLAHPWARMPVAAQDENDEQAGEDAEEDGDLRLLKQFDDARVPRDVDETVTPVRVEPDQRLRAVIEERGQKRKDEYGRVAGDHECPLPTVGNPSSGVS